MLRATSSSGSRLIRALGVGIAYAFDDLALQPLLHMRTGILQLYDLFDDVDGQIKPINLIADCEFKWSVDIALLLVVAPMDVGMIRSRICELVD